MCILICWLCAGRLLQRLMLIYSILLYILSFYFIYAAKLLKRLSMEFYRRKVINTNSAKGFKWLPENQNYQPAYSLKQRPCPKVRGIYFKGNWKERKLKIIHSENEYIGNITNTCMRSAPRICRVLQLIPCTAISVPGWRILSSSV